MMKAVSILLVAAYASLAAIPSWAECNGSVNRPGEPISFSFAKNSSVLEKAESEKFDAWIVEMNGKYSIQNWLSIVGQAGAFEDKPDDLALSRAAYIAKRAIDARFIKAPIEIKSYVGSMGNPASAGPAARTVAVELSPGCPNNCCDRQ